MREYAFGVSASWLDEAAAASDADGDTATLPAGDYLLTVINETVELAFGVATVAAGAGTPLIAGTQLHIRNPSSQSVSYRSAGGTGRITFTRLTNT